jgi:hypothetical protein
MFQGSNIVLTNDPLADCGLCLDKADVNLNNNNHGSNNFSLNLGNNNLNNSATNNHGTLPNLFNFNITQPNDLPETFKTPLTTLAPLIKQTQSQSQNQSKKENSKKAEKSETNSSTKSDVFQNLLSQLNGLEKLVKNAKKELTKYEKQDGFEDFSANIENLFKI